MNNTACASTRQSGNANHWALAQCANSGDTTRAHPSAACLFHSEEGTAKITRFCLAALAGASFACASGPAPVAVSGEAGDRASLAGKWVGEYNSPATGRSGSIGFNLSPSGEAATGDVVMIPRGYGRALVRFDPGPTTPMQAANSSQVLTIKLVRVSGDTMSGALDAYRDPLCDCPVVTTFAGRLNGDTIDGTFATSGRMAAGPQTGSWRVKRTTR